MNKHQYCCQNKAQNYLDHIIPIPNFKVNTDCLYGFGQQEFINGLKVLTSIIKEMYLDMIQNPIEYGLPLVEDIEYKPFNPKAAESKNSAHRLITLLFIMVQCGEFKNETISIDKQIFLAMCKGQKTKYKTPHSNKILQKLCKFGLKICGLSAKGFDKNLNTFTVSYPDKNVIYALYGYMKNALLTKDAIMPLNYHIAVSPDDLPDNYLQVIFAEYLSGNEKEFYKQLNDFMDEKEFLCKKDEAYRFYLGYFIKQKDKQYFMRCFSDYGKLLVCFKLNYINTYTEYIESLPERVKQMFRKESNCYFCHESCGCRHQWIFEGKESTICGYNQHFDIVYYNPDDIDYYKNIILYELKAMKENKNKSNT